MGGYGSGRQDTTGGQTTGNSLAFDVRQLSRADCLRPGRLYGWKWWTRRWGERQPAGDVHFVVYAAACDGPCPGRAESLRLLYRTRTRRGSDAGEWESVQEDVPLEWTACHYGGQGRPWFRCPGCARRCAVLYCPWGKFRCRVCHRLPYPSQREAPPDRLLGKAIRLRERLGQEGGGVMAPFPERPRGMHDATYLRLRWQAKEAELRYWHHVAQRFGFGIGDGTDARTGDGKR